jgi:hypothetical protein
MKKLCTALAAVMSSKMMDGLRLLVLIGVFGVLGLLAMKHQMSMEQMVWIGLSQALYFLPWIIADNHDHPQLVAITALNLFLVVIASFNLLGWMVLLGWVAVLIWSSWPLMMKALAQLSTREMRIKTRNVILEE